MDLTAHGGDIYTLARELGMNKYHLSHVFSEKMGQSFPAYLSRIRISCACSA